MVWMCARGQLKKITYSYCIYTNRRDPDNALLYIFYCTFWVCRIHVSNFDKPVRPAGSYVKTTCVDLVQ